MGSFLYRLGSAAFHRKGIVIAVWLAILATLGVGAWGLAGPNSDSFEIPGTQSQAALDILNERFPAISAGNASAQVVISAHGDGALTTPADRAVVEKVVDAVGKAPQVKSTLDPYQAGMVSRNGKTAIISVTYSVTAPNVSASARSGLKQATSSARIAGLTVEYAGTATVPPTGLGGTEALGLIIAAIVLLITFGSLIAAGLPLLNAVVGVAATFLGIQIASGLVQLSSTTSTLALMLGVAVAIDYSLFIVSRYRHELEGGRTAQDAAGRAIASAGSAVVIAGLTVIVALAGLSVVNIPFLTAMGLAGAGSVFIAVLVALTLLPALLGVAGGRIYGRKQRRQRASSETSPSRRPPVGERWGRFVLRRRWVLLPVAVIAALICAIPALSLRTSLVTALDPSTTQARAANQIGREFGPGYNGTLLVVIDEGTGSMLTAAANEAQKSISKLPDASAVASPVFNSSRNVAILTVVPRSGPTAAATESLVREIRTSASSLDARRDTRLQVTGQTALNIDVADRLAGALPPYVALIVVFALLLLLLLFRSILVPIKAVLGFLLSLAASLGAVVAVFQFGWLNGFFGVPASGPVMSLLPIFLVGVLFGLSMDYEVFLVTRMLEAHENGASPRESVIAGMNHGARVVTAAALIMISVFAGFVTSDQTIIKSLGFALAFGVFIDAFVVRMTIVPAVMFLLGKSAWWLPHWLPRLLPRIDIEGSTVAKQIAPTVGEDHASPTA